MTSISDCVQTWLPFPRIYGIGMCCICSSSAVLSFSFIFFFSSRRRHTRYIGDWSSDVCSSDLQPVLLQVAQETQAKELVKQVQEMQERLLRDPEAAKALEELLKYFQAPPEEEIGRASCRERV